MFGYHVDLGNNERGEPTASLRWMVDFENYPVEVQDFREIIDWYLWNIPRLSKEKPKDHNHVTGSTWKHKDFDQLCPKIFPDTKVLSIKYVKEGSNHGFDLFLRKLFK